MKKSKKLHKYIDDLYKLLNHLLYTITYKSNEDFLSNPDIYKNNIELNVPEASNYYNSNDLY